ncbi:ABA4-like family protein [Poritiphilus flavus]|uniref:DUF4281 domain-containing protein n=1 Tax=Poritiphilus flavus TaxID=2697053 RepID=A0A6L9EGB0_9FLAO|nr:ABA4-like family protein [Poritiphilus flavus]NAS13289.1 DUF4281 domain-containing protein [Poritiphilus flavus]
MTPTTVFSLANLLVMPMWILMILFPKWKVTRFLMDYKLVPILLSFLYGIYVFLTLQGGGVLDFGSLSAVMRLFTLENAAMAGWVHYLAFDLLVGFWILEQNRSVGLHQLLMAPCLIGTFMLGPLGFLLFILLRTLKVKRS